MQAACLPCNTSLLSGDGFLRLTLRSRAGESDASDTDYEAALAALEARRGGRRCAIANPTNAAIRKRTGSRSLHAASKASPIAAVASGSNAHCAVKGLIGMAVCP